MRAHNGAQHLAANVAGRITDDIGRTWSLPPEKRPKHPSGRRP